jgi:hypothetical protein
MAVCGEAHGLQRGLKQDRSNTGADALWGVTKAGEYLYAVEIRTRNKQTPTKWTWVIYVIYINGPAPAT